MADEQICEATDERPVHHLVTSGMSSRPMDEADEDERLAELMVVLPREWRLDEESWRDELIDGFERARVSEEVDTRRRSAVRRKRFGLF